MGKKRRLIKKTGKFIHKHSNHPILKQRNLNTDDTVKEIKETIEKVVQAKEPVKVELKQKVEKPIEVELKPKVEKLKTKIEQPKPKIQKVSKTKKKTTRISKVKKTKAVTD